LKVFPSPFLVNLLVKRIEEKWIEKRDFGQFPGKKRGEGNF
jgi:hypothetical protein